MPLVYTSLYKIISSMYNIVCLTQEKNAKCQLLNTN